MYEITRTTPSSITVKNENRIVKIFGESYMRGHGSPDFVIDVSSIINWKDGDSLYPIDAQERERITEFVILELRGRGWDIVAE